MNSDIIARWRDAISDPPEDGKAILLHGANADELLVAYRRGTSWHEWEGLCIRIDPGDQWLDVTDMPAVPREQVQAAVDEMKFKADGAVLDTLQEIAAIGIRGSIGCIAHHTGITPSEVQP